MENYRGIIGAPDKVVARDDRDAEWVKNKLALEVFEDTDVLEFERPKTIEEEIIAHWIIENLPKFLEAYGLEAPKLISYSDIRMIDSKKSDHKEISNLIEMGGGGAYIPGTNRVYALSGPENLLRSAHIIAHELVHAHSFSSVETELDESGKNIYTHQRRFGLIIVNKDEEFSNFFMFLNEAITEELTRKFAEKYFPGFFLISEEFKKIQEKVTLQGILRNTPMEQLIDEEFSDQKFYCYPNERGILAFLINDIFNFNQGRFTTHDDVFKLFTRAMLHGELLPLARVIEKTYGKGNFRKIAELTRERQPDFINEVTNFLKRTHKRTTDNSKKEGGPTTE